MMVQEMDTSAMTSTTGTEQQLPSSHGSLMDLFLKECHQSTKCEEQLTQEDIEEKARVEALANFLKNTAVEYGFIDKDNWYIAFD